MHYFSIFFKKFKNHALIFRGLDENHKLLGNFEKILKFFDENSIEKLQFFYYFWKICY